MAKNNNLTDFLTDLADVIRSKKGTTAKINPQNFSSEIASIETGGGSTGGVLLESDVNFYEYDGTLLHSYTKDEFLALSALPDLPTRKGLICQEWNYTFEKAKEYVTDYGVLDIGATYITDDGKTRLYINIEAKGRMDVVLYFTQTVSDGVVIDWGDGSETQTLSGVGNKNIKHIYSDLGEFVIALEPINSCILGFGNSYGSYCMMGPLEANGNKYTSKLRAVEIGANVTSMGRCAFRDCKRLSSISIPNSVTSIKDTPFHNCFSLSSIVIPNGVTNLESFHNCYSLSKIVMPSGVITPPEFYNCKRLSSISIPNSVTSLRLNAFYACTALSRISIPNNVTSIGDSAFYTCSSLSSVEISDSVTSIGTNAFYACPSLSSIKICGETSIGKEAFRSCTSLLSVVFKKVVSISESAFYGCTWLAIADFSQCISIPSLSSASAFSSVASDLKIVVPDELYDTWITATNWSYLASKIVKSSEFNG